MKEKKPTASGLNKGILITFEGGEGVGKSTQIKSLQKKLEENGFQTITSREPGGTAGAEAVRHVILEAGTAEPFGPGLEAIMFAAARNDHVEQVIRPAISAGKIVLIDRYMDSTRVYQGTSGRLSNSFIRHLERIAIAGMVPDLTIVLDLPPEEGMKRAHQRRSNADEADRFEKEGLAVHAARRDAFLDLARAELDRMKVVDASGNAEQVAERIWKSVLTRFPYLGIKAPKLAEKQNEASS